MEHKADLQHNYPLVSIITVNYNQSQVTLELLETLNSLTYPNVEIIVVDNDSPNDNPQLIKESFPDVKLIISDENLGFAGGNNLGIKASKGDYLMFLNNDTEVPPGFLEPLVDLLVHNKHIGMVSPKIKYHWNPEQLQYAGFTEISHFTVKNVGIGFNQLDAEQFNQLTRTASVHGAAMMIPRSVVDEVGLMPEVYFLYYEEHDWAESVKRAGYDIYYHPGSYMLHKESVSTGKNSPLKTYYLNRGRFIFARRNFKGFTLFINTLYLLFISIPKNIIFFLLKREIVNLISYLRACVWYMGNFRRITNKK